MPLYPATERPQPVQPHGVNRWALSSRIFHWVSVLLLIITWVMVEMNEEAVTDTYLDLHKAFGLSVLFWTLGRIINRFVTKAPADVPMPAWQTKAAHLTHAALYALLLAMPLSAWLATMLRGNGVDMFGLFSIPTFLGEDRALSRNLMGLHKEILWPTLLLFTGLHVVGALYHQFIKKDGLLRRMR